MYRCHSIIPFLLALVSTAGFSADRPVHYQTLTGFDNPISCAFDLSGDLLFVVNSARGEYGWVSGRGAVSKVAVAADGTLSMIDDRFVTGLGGPMGIAILPVEIGRFAAGTIFVSQGGAWVVNRSGELVRNTFDLETGVFAIDPESGRIVGKLLMGPGTRFSQSLGHGVVNPLGICFNPAGDLFVCDGGSGGPNLSPPVDGRAGIIRIPADQLDSVAAGNGAEGLDFLGVANGPTTLFWHAASNSLMATTGSGMGPLGGAVFRLPRGDFSERGSVETVGSGLTAVAGAFITPAGTAIAIVNSGEIRRIRSKEKSKDIRLRPELYLVTPGAPAAKTLPDGRIMTVIPEQAGGGIADWHQQVQVILFPSET
ncbi:MAG: hypothetical protein R3F07_18495 [Opitutaceae bacterium]